MIRLLAISLFCAALSLPAPLSAAAKKPRKSEAAAPADTTASKQSSPAEPQSDSEPPVMIAEKMPSFRGGGLGEFRQWVMSNLKFPEEMARQEKTGRVMINFVIDTEGRMTNVGVFRSSGEFDFDEAAVNLIKRSPRWSPGEQRGKKVRVRYTLPIDFGRR